jgi:hypothetical protein
MATSGILDTQFKRDMREDPGLMRNMKESLAQPGEASAVAQQTSKLRALNFSGVKERFTTMRKSTVN